MSRKSRRERRQAGPLGSRRPAGRGSHLVTRRRSVQAFLLSAVASAIIGAIFTPQTFVAVKNSVVGGGGSHEPSLPTNVLPSQIVTASSIGNWQFEENGAIPAAEEAFGIPQE